MKKKEKRKKKKEGSKSVPLSFFLCLFSSSRQGLTIVELLVVLGVTVVFLVIGLPNLVPYRGNQRLSLATDELRTIIQSTQHRAMTQEDNRPWGIRFVSATTSPSYIVFSGPSYASGTVYRTYDLRRGVSFSDPAVGAYRDIVFATLTGTPAAYTSVTLTLPEGGSSQKSIVVSAVGAVSIIDSQGLSVKSIVPAGGSNAGSVSISLVRGSGFTASSAVGLSRSEQPNIPLTGYAVTDQTTVSGGAFNLSGAAPGIWDVFVANSASSTATLVGGFTVRLPAPSVTSMTPSSATAGSVLSGVSIAGSNFQAGNLSVWLSMSGQPTIIGSNFTYASPASLVNGSLSLSDAALGLWDVVVTNSDGQSGVRIAGFQVNGAIGPFFDIAASGSNALGGGFCAALAAWTGVELCVRVPAGVSAGVQALTITSAGYNSNTPSFSVP